MRAIYLNDGNPHFVLVRINTRRETRNLKRVLHLKTLRKECHQIWLKLASPKAREYKTLIEIFVPTRRFFELLKQYEKPIQSYEITYIKFANYKFGKNKRDSYISIFDRIELAKKNPTTDHNIKTRNDEDYPAEDKAFYYKHENLKKTIYPKARHINTQIFIQEEWEINSATAIKGRTGIETIEDLKNFDIQEFWDTHDKPLR